MLSDAATGDVIRGSSQFCLALTISHGAIRVSGSRHVGMNQTTSLPPLQQRMAQMPKVFATPDPPSISIAKSARVRKAGFLSYLCLPSCPLRRIRCLRLPGALTAQRVLRRQRSSRVPGHCA